LILGLRNSNQYQQFCRREHRNITTLYGRTAGSGVSLENFREISRSGGGRRRVSARNDKRAERDHSVREDRMGAPRGDLLTGDGGGSEGGAGAFAFPQNRRVVVVGVSRMCSVRTFRLPDEKHSHPAVKYVLCGFFFLNIYISRFKKMFLFSRIIYTYICDLIKMFNN